MSAIMEHNRTLLRTLEEGDQIEFTRGLYSHWAVYIGNGMVIHLTGENDGIGDGLKNPGKSFTICGKQFSKACVTQSDFWDVASDCKAKKNNDKDEKCSPLSKFEIVRRALSRLGQIGYNVLWNNCEHFAAWCRYDKAWSEQVDTALTVLTFGSIVAAGIGFIWAMTPGSSRRTQSHQGKR